MKLGGVGQDPGRRVVDVRVHLDLGRQSAAHQRDDVLDEGLQPEGVRVGRVAAAEGEDLSHDLLGPLRPLQDRLQALGQGRVALGVEHRELRVAHDPGQDVVEVVCDAARQGADRLHLLGVHQVRFEVLLRGDVDGDPDPVGGAVVPPERL